MRRSISGITIYDVCRVSLLDLTTHGIQITESTLHKSHLSNEMSSPTEMSEIPLPMVNIT